MRPTSRRRPAPCIAFVRSRGVLRELHYKRAAHLEVICVVAENLRQIVRVPSGDPLVRKLACEFRSHHAPRVALFCVR
jgi:hypothetical protein